MIKEFKAFAMRGNVMDMAVGIIIGGAFGKVISSLVNDILMPPIGLLLGKVDFSHAAIHITQNVSLRYGLFINTVVDFLIVAFAMFLVVRQCNRFSFNHPPAEPEMKVCHYCQTSIAKKAIRCPQCTSQLTE